MSVRATIIDEAVKIAAEQGLAPPLITDDLPLAASGLNSLGFAVLVVRLEEQLGTSPFYESEDVEVPVTFGDFVRLYERARTLQPA